MKTLYLECNMGAAGDMLMAALYELLEDKQGFLDTMNGLGLPGVRLEAQPASTCGIAGNHMAVTVDGQEVALTPVEYKIVKFLMENRGLVFSSAQIYENVWNEPSYGADNIVAVHIRHIREKIEINPKEPRYIKVIWGHGYKMEKL